MIVAVAQRKALVIGGVQPRGTPSRDEVLARANGEVSRRRAQGSRRPR